SVIVAFALRRDTGRSSISRTLWPRCLSLPKSTSSTKDLHYREHRIARRNATRGSCLRSPACPSLLRFSSVELCVLCGEGFEIDLLSARHHPIFTLRSPPVISLGSGRPSMPRIVGEISRNEPPLFSLNSLKFSAITMKG